MLPLRVCVVAPDSSSNLLLRVLLNLLLLLVASRPASHALLNRVGLFRFGFFCCQSFFWSESLKPLRNTIKADKAPRLDRSTNAPSEVPSGLQQHQVNTITHWWQQQQIRKRIKVERERKTNRKEKRISCRVFCRRQKEPKHTCSTSSSSSLSLSLLVSPSLSHSLSRVCACVC